MKIDKTSLHRVFEVAVAGMIALSAYAYMV